MASGDISEVDEEAPAADRNSNYLGVPSQGSLSAEYLSKATYLHFNCQSCGLPDSMPWHEHCLIERLPCQLLCGAGWMLHFHRRPDYVLVIDGGSSGTRM
jgi:hypothetical protein